MPDRSPPAWFAKLLGAVALGLVAGATAFVLGASWIGDSALVVAVVVPPLLIAALHGARGTQLVILSVVGIAAALGAALAAAGGYST